MAPSDNKMPDDEFTPLISVQFFMVTSVIGVVPVEPISNIFGLVTLVLLMVRFLELDPLLEPSIVTYLPRIRISAELLAEPVIVAFTPVLGLMVSVLVDMDIYKHMNIYQGEILMNLDIIEGLVHWLCHIKVLIMMHLLAQKLFLPMMA